MLLIVSGLIRTARLHAYLGAFNAQRPMVEANLIAARVCFDLAFERAQVSLDGFECFIARRLVISELIAKE
jgi:hypothetical protein